MYLGHLTKRVRSLFGWMSPPILKLRAFFSNNGLLAACAPFPTPAEAVTTFFPFETFFTYNKRNH